MAYLKINNKLILDEMDIDKLLKSPKLKDIRKNKGIIMGLLVIAFYLMQEWFISGITINYLKRDLKDYLQLLNPALNFIKNNAKNNEFVSKFVKKHKIKFYD